MTAQIIPRNQEVSDRFPALGFTVRSDTDGLFEVALATDPALFRRENAARRNAGNFYSSGEDGMTRLQRGVSVCSVPLRVLQRFVGTDRLYYALVAARGEAVVVLPEPSFRGPSVSLRHFTGGSIDRSRARAGKAP